MTAKRKENKDLTVKARKVKWTKEAIVEAAAGCEDATEFRKKNHSAYMAAYYRHMLDEMFPKTVEVVFNVNKPAEVVTVTHEIALNNEDMKSNRYKNLTLDQVLVIAKGCNSYKEFMTKYKNTYYHEASKRGWLGKVKAHVDNTEEPAPRKRKHQKPTKWSVENLIEEAKRYSSYKEFKTKSKSAYVTACKRGLADFIENTVWADTNEEEEAAPVAPVTYTKEDMTGSYGVSEMEVSEQTVSPSEPTKQKRSFLDKVKNAFYTWRILLFGY